MRNRVTIAALVGVVAVGVIALAVRGLGSERPFAQRLGVQVHGPVAKLRPGDEGCQGPVALAERTSRVEFNPGTPKAVPGPRMGVTIRDYATRRVLGTGTLQQGFDPRVPQTVAVTPVAADSRVDVCFRNTAPSGVVLLFGDRYLGNFGDLHGNISPVLTTSTATLNGKDTGNDIAIVFPYVHPRSETSLLPTMFRRASLWRPAFVGQGLYWVLLVLMIVGAPLLLGRALHAAMREDPS